MALRRDALCAAAEFVLAVEALGRSVPGLVATVGQLQVQPGATNVVPGAVHLSLDLRHEDDAVCARSASQLHAEAERICAGRHVELTSQLVQRSPTVFCAPELVRRWEQALSEMDLPVFALPSGAGHDGVALSELTDVSMLFVRCKGGISHHPAEAVRGMMSRRRWRYWNAFCS